MQFFCIVYGSKMWKKIKNIPVILGMISLYLAGGSCHLQVVSKHPNLSLLRNDICGPVYPSTRISNGKKAALLELPWMAEVNAIRGKKFFLCGGTVINERYVLTAAHCIMPKHRYVVYLGSRNRKGNVDCEVRVEKGRKKKLCAPKPQEIGVEDIITHSNFTEEETYSDIALLRLSEKADLTSSGVKPICLPIGAPLQNGNITGRRAEIAGWGQTKAGGSSSLQLMKASIIIEDIRKCSIYKYRRLEDLQICAGARRDRRDTCDGDSGGPLTMVEYVHGRLKTVQYGITSFGNDKCGDPDNPTVFTRVGYYTKWILDNMKP